jgi:hypothetical protein
MESFQEICLVTLRPRSLDDDQLIIFTTTKMLNAPIAEIDMQYATGVT